MGRKLFLLVFFCLYTFSLPAKISLASIWQDNMVLQQNSTVIIAGYSNIAKKIWIDASWDGKKIKTECSADGHFSVMLKTPSYGGPYTISFYDGDKLTLKNILIGEVWFCSGQSNMEMPVKGFRGQPVYGSLEYIISAEEKRPMRLFTVKNSWSTTPMSDSISGQWNETSTENVSNFSAVAYFFGDLLQKTLKVPIGLINCSWSASKIEAWMDREALKPFVEVKLPDSNQTAFEWPAGTPTLLWNAMVNPWKGFPIKGVLWYQGEANTPNPDLYRSLFPAMINQWRTFWEQPAMPFYYVQIAPWASEGSDKYDWALFRQCQLDAMRQIPDVGMVVTADLGSENFIHPPYKTKVGERLAYWALAKTYGIKGFMYSGPIYKECQLKNGKVEVNFDFGEDGLTPENEPVIGFELVGDNGLVYPASAEIINGSSIVKVWNENVLNPTEVRYCFRNFKLGNLCNNIGLPAAPFKTIINK
ncbi:MAG: sialate O-acetylesterase [Bacteroides graminisolvens]|jgi:hypothetical protein|nr:sialate O-acetylesterase [Bacteroides graminisolvens]